VFVVSSALKSHFESKYPNHAHKLVVTPNAINLARAKSDPELRERLRHKLGLEEVDYVIGFVGSIFRYHGVDRLLKDFARLTRSSRDRKFKMIIVGDGAVLEDLRRQAVDLDINSLVTFCGNVPHEEVYTYIDVMDIAVMARSNWYGSPVKVFEYGAMKKAIIAPDNIPLRDVMVNREDGILVGNGEHEVFEAMNFFIAHPDKMSEFADSFHRKVIREHTWNHVAEKIITATRQVIDQRKPLEGFGLEWGRDVLVLRTDFRHHGRNSGYKQILKYIRPSYTLGLVEGDNAIYGKLKLKYQWLFERDIKKFLPDVDLIHIMYAEDYLRFAPGLYPRIPVVATFHQPADTLRIEITSGATRGRLGQITHWLSRSRFRKLAAAIVTEESQKSVLAKVMDPEKIHVIPLGVHLAQYHEKFHQLMKEDLHSGDPQIITVGNWLRDWPFYAEVVARCAEEKPQWKFHLVNRKLPAEVSGVLSKLKNLVIHQNVDDDKLKELLFSARCHFLPVTAASGNNALMEGLAMGCPVVMTDVVSQKFPLISESLKLYRPGDADQAIELIDSYCALDKDAFAILKQNTFAMSLPYDWAEIARQTMDVYKELVK
jgi:glycosyltransferase involved in cell wall biosynthesis